MFRFRLIRCKAVLCNPDLSKVNRTREFFVTMFLEDDSIQVGHYLAVHLEIANYTSKSNTTRSARMPKGIPDCGEEHSSREEST